MIRERFAAFFRRNPPKESPATISRLNRLWGALKRGKLGPEVRRTLNTAAFRAFAPPPFPGGACSDARRRAGARARAEAKTDNRNLGSITLGALAPRVACGVSPCCKRCAVALCDREQAMRRTPNARGSRVVCFKRRFVPVNLLSPGTLPYKPPRGRVPR